MSDNSKGHDIVLTIRQVHLKQVYYTDDGNRRWPTLSNELRFI
jgi:hypothetical protein